MNTPPPDLPVAILAGGLATRLHPITEKIPKSLVPVVGKPFLDRQLMLLRLRGIRHVVLCVGYLGEMIQRDFGNRFYDIKLDYSFDGPKLLGTGGAIQRALPMLGDEFFVLYGDSYLPIDYLPVAEFFQSSGKLGCMTVFHNAGRFDTSNVVFFKDEIKIYDKKARLPEMQHIDYGLSLFKAAAFNGFPAGQPLDLADVLGKLVGEKQLAGYEVNERFYEIGSPAGLAELENLFMGDTE